MLKVKLVIFQINQVGFDEIMNMIFEMSNLACSGPTSKSAFKILLYISHYMVFTSHESEYLTV